VLDLSLDVKDKEYVTLVQRKTGHRMKLRRTRGLITVIKAVTRARSNCGSQRERRV
jgi:hypothetical protein